MTASAISVIWRVTPVPLTRGHQRRQQFRDARGDAGQRRIVARRRDIAHQHRTRDRLHPHQVGLGNHADQPAVRNDRQMADAVLGHDGWHVGAKRLRVQRQRGLSS